MIVEALAVYGGYKAAQKAGLINSNKVTVRKVLYGTCNYCGEEFRLGYIEDVPYILNNFKKCPNCGATED